MAAGAEPWISIASDGLAAQIDPLGAQLSRLTDGAGNELLWNGDASVWSGRAPILFPIVGVLAGGRYRLGTRSYPLTRHGFARGKMFSVERADANSALLTLKADEATGSVYPFAFQLDVHFALRGATLLVTSTVRNTGSDRMPASFGYHPAFRWPLPFGQSRSSHVIEFEAEEPGPCRRIDADGLLRPQPRPTPIAHRRLALADELFIEDVLIFDAIRSRSVVYGSHEGPRIRVSFPDAPYLGLWSKPGASFICIEPWHGITDPEGFAGDFADKPGVFVLGPGAALASFMEITLLPGGA